MLKRLILHNIKSHTHTELDLSAGLNVLCGKTNHGKSVIIRAIRWLCYNQPYGWNPRPWKTIQCDDDSYVEGIFEDGTTLRRAITKDDNYYTINDGPRLRALRGAVPDVVADVVAMSDINIQTQDSQYFLLNETPGNVVKIINKITNVSKADQALTNAKARVTKRKAILDTLIHTKAELNNELTSLKWVDDAVSAVSAIQNLENSIAQTQQNVESLVPALNHWHDVKRDLGECQKIVGLGSHVQVLVEDTNKLTSHSNRTNNVDAAINSYYSVGQDLDNVTIPSTVQESLTEHGKLCMSLVADQQRYDNCHKQVQSIAAINNELDTVSPQVDALVAAAALASAVDDLASVGKEIDNVAKVIPTGTDITDYAVITNFIASSELMLNSSTELQQTSKKLATVSDCVATIVNTNIELIDVETDMSKLSNADMCPLCGGPL